nr:unnamed protein product [Digitaria exilis]
MKPQLKRTPNQEAFSQAVKMEVTPYLGTEARERGMEAAGFRVAAERRKAAAAGRAKERRRDAMACRGRRGRARGGEEAATSPAAAAAVTAPTTAESQFAAFQLWNGFHHADMKGKGKN